CQGSRTSLVNSTSSSGWPNNEHAPLDLLYARRTGRGWRTGRLQQRHLARCAFVDRLIGFLRGPVPPSCGLRMPVWHFNFSDLLILTCPVGPEYIGGEHDTRRNLNKLAHRQVFLSGLNVEVRSGVARAAVSHFDAVTGGGQDSMEINTERIAGFISGYFSIQARHLQINNLLIIKRYITFLIMRDLACIKTFLMWSKKC
ncbi:hypothetical protein, partial [Burkholderia sola]|uniref:hypothetical protein n=2 Tax=Burkholderia sola TaxID=2843302 RepID=UPI001C0A8B9B